MQFHLNGFRPGDPDELPEAPGIVTPGRDDWSETVDVLVVGAGPAGLLLAAQLAAFPHISTRIIERRPGPLTLGQADGVACRTVEVFDAFGLSERLVREAYWVNETVFWGPDGEDPGRIVRTGRLRDVEEGLSEMPHVIVNQARLQDLLTERMRKSPRRLEPDYGLSVTAVEIPGQVDEPVTVRMVRESGGPTEEVVARARYVVVCDGARSVVRRSIGRELLGDPQNRAWGVLDVLATTDFPDIRLKAVIQSGSHGNVLLIPREGGYLVRLYVDLGDVVPGAASLRGSITADDIVAAARRVLAPYALEAKEIPWWSVYEVGQRLTDKFDDVEPGSSATPRVFVASDACHTHSAKAGQGMNVSMQDAYNLGWKLAAVLQGRSPASLLATYSEERQLIAQQLIDFDRQFAKVIGARPKGAGSAGSAGAAEAIDDTDDGHYDAAEVERRFQAAGRFTAGLATHYPSSLLTGEPTHQKLAEGFPVGMRFHSAPVVRVADARPMHLGHVHEADGRWRLYAFGDRSEPAHPDSPISRLCAFLADSPDSPVRRHTPPGADVDAVLDLRAVFQQHHHDFDAEQVHPLLLPVKGRLGLKDYEKVFAADSAASQDVFELRRIDRDRGCLVVVRPDQYVAHVLPLDAHEALAGFFAAFMNEGVQAAAASTA